MQEPLMITVRRFCEISSCGKTTAFRLIREGKIESRCVGRRRLIVMESVRSLLDLPDAKWEDN